MAETTVRRIEGQPRQGRDLTEGGIQRAIWSLAPAMMLEMGILNVAQVLDVYWVSRLGSAALAAVTLSTTVRWVLNSLANGLGTGGMAVVARWIGAGDDDAAGRVAGQTILLALGASLLLGGLGLALARPLLMLLGADAAVLPLALRYLRVALGAGQPERSQRSAWCVSAYAAGYVTVVAGVLSLLAPSLIALFDATPQVVALGAECLRVVAFFEVASAVGVVLSRGLDGAGNTLPGMGINLSSLWGVEVAAAFVRSRWLGLGATGVWWGRAPANLANGLLFGWWFQRGRWKRRVV